MRGTVFMCACSSWVDHSVAASQGPSSPSVFDEAPMRYFFLFFFSVTFQTSDIVHSRLLLNSPWGERHHTRAPVSCKVGTSKKKKRTRCHTLALASFHLCPSNDCVPVFGRKMGLCGAQRSESPKAARQIQPLWSTMARIATTPSSFKVHFP